jgi:NAD(P)H-hydrate epimerase
MSLDIYPTISSGELGWLSEKQMIEVDRVMIEDLNIELIQMMENAGRNLARVVLNLFKPASVIVYAGSGGNGGGGLVAARHLANAGVEVAITLTRQADQLSGVPGHQLDILQRMGITTTAPGHSDVAIDALIGYSLRGAPTGHTAALIEQIPRTADAVVSLDTPSGLNVTTGEVPGVVVVADATLTLALPKLGLREASEVGELYVGDISVPPQVMNQVGARPPNFADSPILRVTR